MQYNIIKVTGPVSVEQVDRVRETNMYEYCPLLIMGPTGAGKSTLIETLGLKGSQRISSNKLEGFTQKVSTYLVNNVNVHGYPIYLLDSPGFADTKLSGLAIVSMLRGWLSDNGQRYFSRIMYLTSITHPRLPGSQRQVLNIFKALTGVTTGENIAIVTTMWDSIWGEKAMKRAEGTFNQLRDDIWKEFIEQGSRMVKFENTHDSALFILDETLRRSGGPAFHVDNPEIPLQDGSFATNLYDDLLDRIQNMQSEISNHQLDLHYAESRGDTDLQSILRPRVEEAEKCLARFEQELWDFGQVQKPPAPESEVLGDLEVDTQQKTRDLFEIPPHRRRLPRAIQSMICCGQSLTENHDA